MGQPGANPTAEQPANVPAQAPVANPPEEAPGAVDQLSQIRRNTKFRLDYFLSSRGHSAPPSTREEAWRVLGGEHLSAPDLQRMDNQIDQLIQEGGLPTQPKELAKVLFERLLD